MAKKNRASTKDRPILFSALAWWEGLATLDRGDFGALFGGTFYGLPILTPGMFLDRERVAGRLRELPRQNAEEVTGRRPFADWKGHSPSAFAGRLGVSDRGISDPFQR